MSRSPIFPLAATLILAALLPAAAAADDLEPRFNASVLGMGGAARAVPREISNVELNPGAMVIGDRYAVEVSWGMRGDLDAAVGRMAVIDSHTSKTLVAGTSVDVGWRVADVQDPGWVVVGAGTDPARERVRDFVFALAVPLQPERVGLGASVKTVRRNLPGEDASRQWTTDAGLIFRPLEILSVGLTGNNLVPVDDPDHPTTVAAAASVFLHPQIMLASDFVLELAGEEPVSPAFHVGLAATAADVMPVRLGFYTTPDVDGRRAYMTAGVGFAAGRAGVAYALRLQVDGLGSTGSGAGPLLYHLLTLDVSVF